tara:strand:- start:1803 stop:2807 length:1005 start_codon:yes stop_codon:yes gene_type:complete
MSYIGKEPQVGAYNMLDNLTASATASYSLTLDSVAFVPESANHLLVSLNGVIQKAGSSFTVSGSTLTFSSTLASSDSIDFVLALGNVLDIGTPSDATVTNAKTNFVSTSSAAGLQIKGDGTTDGTLQLNCSQNSHGIKLKSPAHSASQSYTLTFPTTSPSADKFLKTDGSGNLSFANAGGITEADTWRVTTSFTANTSGTQIFTSNWERDDTYQNGNLGTGMTESSGIFTFPSTGFYLVTWFVASNYSAGTSYLTSVIQLTTNNSSYNSVAEANSHIAGVAANYESQVAQKIFDITDLTNQKVRFGYDASHTLTIGGSSNGNTTYVTFIKLGDT